MATPASRIQVVDNDKLPRDLWGHVLSFAVGDHADWVRISRVSRLFREIVSRPQFAEAVFNNRELPEDYLANMANTEFYCRKLTDEGKKQITRLNHTVGYWPPTLTVILANLPYLTSFSHEMEFGTDNK